MERIEKNKNLFIIHLENGKTTYYDFATQQFIGSTGKEIKRFSSTARKILEEYKRDDFLAAYFLEKGLTRTYPRTLNNWDEQIVETLYSLYNKKYSASEILDTAFFCNAYNYVLDRQGVKILSKTLEHLKEEDEDFSNIARTILRFEYPNLPEFFYDCLNSYYLAEEYKKIILEDREKIIFFAEHEEWDCFSENEFYDIEELLKRYIVLCKKLNKERTYKNLFLSICRMEKELRLMKEKDLTNYQNKSLLFYKNENFVVKVPTTAQEFSEEASFQHNCVFRSYFPEVRDKETHVVFIRRADDENTPYITCEISNKGCIKQYLTRYNRRVEDVNALQFRIEYQKFLQEKFSN